MAKGLVSEKHSQIPVVWESQERAVTEANQRTEARPTATSLCFTNTPRPGGARHGDRRKRPNSRPRGVSSVSVSVQSKS